MRLKRLMQYLIFIPRWINYLVAAAVLVIFLTQFVFYNTPELFPGGARLADIAYNLSLAYIVSYVFYAVVYTPQQDDRKKLSEFWVPEVDMVIQIRDVIRQQLMQAGGSTEHEVHSFDQFKAICKNVNPKGPAPMIVLPATHPTTWAEYLIHHVEKTKAVITGASTAVMLTDPATASSMARISTSEFFFLADNVLRMIPYMTNDNLSEFAYQIWDYFELIDDLDSHAKKWRVGPRRYRAMGR